MEKLSGFWKLTVLIRLYLKLVDSIDVWNGELPDELSGLWSQRQSDEGVDADKLELQKKKQKNSAAKFLEYA